jgi:hypothetical protein
MSSSNLVSLRVIEETTLGETPLAGDFSTVRFTSESISGSPTTTESQQIRTDRLSSGQIVTGLEVGGEVSFELAREEVLDKFFASAMMSDWNTQAVQNLDMEIDAENKLIKRLSGDWNTTLVEGDFITLSGFTNSVNNTRAQVLEVVSATIIRVVFDISGGAVVDEMGLGTSYKRADKISIGSTKKSFTFEKAFLDLTNKALIYKGKLVDQMSLNVAYGEIVTGSFSLLGTGYHTASSPGAFVTNGRTIIPPATSNSMNGSIDMPFVSTSALGELVEADFCIQNLSINLNNNLQAQNCIGEVAAKDFSPGQANVEVSLSAYLSDAVWEIIGKKLTQESFKIGFIVKNLDGWYGFYLPAIQTTFDDPSSGGANQEISLEMNGVAKVGANGEKSLTIYRG